MQNPHNTSPPFKSSFPNFIINPLTSVNVVPGQGVGSFTKIWQTYQWTPLQKHVILPPQPQSISSSSSARAGASVAPFPSNPHTWTWPSKSAAWGTYQENKLGELEPWMCWPATVRWTDDRCPNSSATWPPWSSHLSHCSVSKTAFVLLLMTEDLPGKSLGWAESCGTSLVDGFIWWVSGGWQVYYRGYGKAGTSLLVVPHYSVNFSPSFFIWHLGPLKRQKIRRTLRPRVQSLKK